MWYHTTSIMTIFFAMQPLLSADVTKDTSLNPKTTNPTKVEYYRVIITDPDNPLKNKNILVPKSLFDLAIRYHYGIPRQKQLFGYEKSTCHIVQVGCILKPNHNYDPAENKSKFTLELLKYTPLTEKCTGNKHVILKLIVDRYTEHIKTNQFFLQIKTNT